MEHRRRGLRLWVRPGSQQLCFLCDLGWVTQPLWALIASPGQNGHHEWLWGLRGEGVCTHKA